MSATLCVDTYRKYFEVEEDAIFVGVKRFPLTEFHLEEIAQMKAFPRMIQSRANGLMNRMRNVRLENTMNKTATDDQMTLAVDIAKAVARPGRSVLIFVAGIYAIGRIAEQFDECQGHFFCVLYILRCAYYQIRDIAIQEQLYVRTALNVLLSSQPCQLYILIHSRDQHRTLAQMCFAWWQFTRRSNAC